MPGLACTSAEHTTEHTPHQSTHTHTHTHIHKRVIPRSGCVQRLERVESLESLGADGTEICSSAAYWPPYTSPEQHTHTHTHTSSSSSSSVRQTLITHLTLQLRDAPAELRLWSFWKLRVNAAADAPPALLAVFILHIHTHTHTHTHRDTEMSHTSSASVNLL